MRSRLDRIHLLFVLVVLLGFGVAGCASAKRRGMATPGLPYATPGLDLLEPALSEEQRRALAAFDGGNGPEDGAVRAPFQPRGPNVTVHVARATRAWLDGAALYPEAVDRFLANESNFFPDCTICRGVRIAFQDYRGALRSEPAGSSRRRYLEHLDTVLEPAQSTRLRAVQSRSATLALVLAKVYRTSLLRSIDSAERKVFVEAARRMDAYTTEYAKSGEDPRYAGGGCELCQAVTRGLPSK